MSYKITGTVEEIKKTLGSIVETPENERLISLDEPAILIPASNLLYPQHDARAAFHQWMQSDEVTSWLATEAFKLLQEGRGAREVRERWHMLVDTYLSKLKHQGQEPHVLVGDGEGKRV